MKKQDTEKGNTVPLPSSNTVCNVQDDGPGRHQEDGTSPPCSPKLAAHFKAEFNPATKDNVLEKSPCISFTEDVGNSAKKHETVLEMNERLKWRKATLAVTLASLVASVIFCAASFFASATTNSSSVLASALDTLLSVFSASVVIWRFKDPSNGKIGPKREKCGSIAFGIAFTVNGFITIAVSSFHLAHEMRPRHSDLLWPVLMGFSVVYCVLALIEFWISKKLKSSVLISLCIDDAVTSGLLLGLAISALMLDQYPLAWYLDHIVALGLAVVILACGIKILVEIFVYKELPFQYFMS